MNKTTIVTGLTCAAASLAVIFAPIAAADPAPAPAPKPAPLSAAGLGFKVPELSASGLLNGGKPFTNPPLSAKGILGLLFPPGTIVRP